MRAGRSGQIPVVVVLGPLTAIAVVTTALGGQTIRGKVTQANTNEPVPVATITLLTGESTPTAVTVKTDETGGFVVVAPEPGVYRVLAVTPGFRPGLTPAVELAAGDEINLAWTLAPDTVRLRPVVVTASNRRPAGPLGGLAARQRRGFGHLITKEQIESRAASRVSDLLATVPGLRIRPTRWASVNDVLSTSGCRPQVYLDGVRYPLRGETIDQIVSPSMLQAIEVYPHAAEVPAEFSGPGSECGVLALWTK